MHEDRVCRIDQFELCPPYLAACRLPDAIKFVFIYADKKNSLQFI